MFFKAKCQFTWSHVKNTWFCPLDPFRFRQSEQTDICICRDNRPIGFFFSNVFFLFGLWGIFLRVPSLIPGVMLVPGIPNLPCLFLSTFNISSLMKH